MERMTMATEAFGRLRRRRRIYDEGRGILIVPLDHSVSTGPLVAGRRLTDLAAEIAANGADAVVLHKGAIRRLDPRRMRHTSLVLHLSAGTRYGPDPDAKCLVATVEEALLLGADAVSVHVNVGSLDEQRQLADLAAVSAACDRWNVPLLAMMYPRGPAFSGPVGPDAVALAATIAAELGADLVKTVYPGSIDAMRDVVRAVPIPVLIAGGPRTANFDELLARVRDALAGGAAGVAVGRNVFASPSPAKATRQIADVVRQPTRMYSVVSA
jgi:2-amino-4,5-dihydroxy-6-oxo-7-(phosphooxy)heptanoate synthase